MAKIPTLLLGLFFLSLVCEGAPAPQRVITTSPSLTELVYQIGGQAKLAATVDYSFYPEDAKKLPTIGSFFSPSIEKTVLFKPDLVLIDGAARNFSFEQALNRLGIPFEVLSVNSLSTLNEVSLRLQKIFGSSKVKELQTLAVTQKHYSFIGFVWTNPSIVLSKNTFLNSLIESTGGLNLSEFQTEQSYLTVSKEWLILSRPEVVFLLTEFDFQKEDFIKFSKEIWPQKSPKVVFLPSVEFARTTYTALEGINKVNEEIHGFK